jgi:hypothetical protein
MILFLSKHRILNTLGIAHGTVLVDDPKAEKPNLTGLVLKMAGGHTVELNASDGSQVIAAINRENQCALLSAEMIEQQAAAMAMRWGNGLITS